MLKEFIFEVDGKRISIKALSLEEAVKELKGKRYYLLTTCPVSTSKKKTPSDDDLQGIDRNRLIDGHGSPSAQRKTAASFI